MAEQVGTDTPTPHGGTWVIDTAHSSVGFTARYMMMSKVRGQFDSFEGTLHVEDPIERSWVEVTIDAASFDSGNEKRDGHVLSADFLDVEHYPHVTFRSTGWERVGETNLRVTGDLTIRDVTKPVVLDAEYHGLARDPWGNDRIAFTATTQIDRDEFDVRWNQALETGGVLVGPKVGIEIDAQLIPKAEEQTAEAQEEAEAGDQRSA
jgi:polyisoprenoid-binding protein YceI